MAGQVDTFILIILAFIFPPAAAGFVTGCGLDLGLNLLLTLLGYFPGCFHAFWLVLRRAEANERYGYKNWTYFGMGEYAPVGAQGLGSGQYSGPYGPAPPLPVPPPPPPPSGQYPAVGTPPPSHAPAGPKSGGYGYGYGLPPPSAPPEQKGGYHTPPQTPGDRKEVDVAPPAPAGRSGGT